MSYLTNELLYKSNWYETNKYGRQQLEIAERTVLSLWKSYKWTPQADKLGKKIVWQPFFIGEVKSILNMNLIINTSATALTELHNFILFIISLLDSSCTKVLFIFQFAA